jgi:hypothetical protein
VLLWVNEKVWYLSEQLINALQLKITSRRSASSSRYSSTCSSPYGAHVSGGVILADTLTYCSLELIVWFVPSLIGGAVAVSLVGVLLGPIYPIAMNEARRILPRWLLTGCIGWIAGLGQAGSAALPFMTGAIASKAGIKSMQPL